MQHFTTRKGAFREVRKKLIITTLSTYGIGVFTVLYFLHASKEEPDDTWIYTLMLITPVLCFTAYRTVKRQRESFESFRLTITDDAVIREQLNTPTITIPKAGITAITRTRSGIFCVIGKNKLNAIAVPVQIDNRNELEQALSQIKPVVLKSPWTALVFVQLAAMLFILIGGFLGLLSHNKIIFTISGMALCSLLAYSFIIVHRSKNFDKRVKRVSYITIIPFLAIMANVMMRWLEE